MSRKNKFTFDPEKHEYRLNGFKLPSVTEVIGTTFGNKPYWNEEVRVIGSGLHKALHHCFSKLGMRTGADFREVDLETIDERIMVRFEAFVAFLETFDVMILESEVRLFSEKYRFAGTLDLIIEVAGKTSLVDIKSSHEPEHEIQVGGYYELLKKKPASVVILELKKDGSFREHPVENPKESALDFLACLRIHNFKLRNKMLK